METIISFWTKSQSFFCTAVVWEEVGKRKGTLHTCMTNNLCTYIPLSTGNQLVGHYSTTQKLTELLYNQPISDIKELNIMTEAASLLFTDGYNSPPRKSLFFLDALCTLN